MSTTHAAGQVPEPPDDDPEEQGVTPEEPDESGEAEGEAERHRSESRFSRLVQWIDGRMLANGVITGIILAVFGKLLNVLL